MGEPLNPDIVAANMLCEELLVHKYRYHILNAPVISDQEYDMLQRKWVTLRSRAGCQGGPAHWVGFDRYHPLAGKAVERIARESAQNDCGGIGDGREGD